MTTALHYNDQVALSGAVRGSDYDLSFTQLHQHQDESATALPHHDTPVYPGTVSQTLQKLHKGLSLLPISNGHNEAGVPSSGNNYQQLYIPVLVASLPNQVVDDPGNPAAGIFPNGLGKPATTPTPAVDVVAINGTEEEKAGDEKSTITPPAKELKTAFENKNHSIHVETIEVIPSPPSTPTKEVSPKLSQEEFLSSATRLKKRIEETDELIVCPGVYDGFSARIALHVGFTALYMTGAGTTASRLGMADLGVAQLHDMREHAEMIANLDPQGPPLIADMDTGYGGPIMVTNSVLQYIRAGVAGFHIEDQVQTKRCGHLQGKKVVDIETFLSRIRAAKAAKDRAQSDIVLIARTDANQQHGYDECIKRLKAAREIGADVGLLEGFKSKEEARQAVIDLAPWPLLLNSVENGTSPLITTEEAKEMGFRIMIFSFASLAPAYSAIKAALEKLKKDGVTGTKKELTPKVLFEVCGLKDSMEVDMAAGGLAFAGGV